MLHCCEILDLLSKLAAFYFINFHEHKEDSKFIYWLRGITHCEKIDKWSFKPGKNYAQLLTFKVVYLYYEAQMCFGAPDRFVWRGKGAK